MILISLLTALLSAVFWVLGSVNIPALPLEIMSALNFIVTLISGSVQFLVYLLGAPLFLAVLVVVPALIAAEYAYGLITFFLKFATAGVVRLGR